MKRQLQVKNGIANGEWRGSGGMPVPPDNTWTFLDVTDRPEAQVGMTYDAATDTFSAPPAPPPVDPEDLPLTPREQRAWMRAVRAKTDKIV